MAVQQTKESTISIQKPRLKAKKETKLNQQETLICNKTVKMY